MATKPNNYGIVPNEGANGQHGTIKYRGADGRIYTLDASTASGTLDQYNYNSTVFNPEKGYHLDAAIQYVLKYGQIPSQQILNDIMTASSLKTLNSKQYNRIIEDLNKFATNNNTTVDFLASTASNSDTNSDIDIVVDTAVKGNNAAKTYTLPDGTTASITNAKKTYDFNNFLNGAKGYQLDAAIQYFIETGINPDKETLNYILNNNGLDMLNDRQYNTIIGDLNTFKTENNLTDEKMKTILNNVPSEAPESSEAPENSLDDYQTKAWREANLDPYYRDIYSTTPGTTGGTIYDNLVQAEQRAAINNMQLADAQLQQQAMAQAETVKQITDQVRAERLARLRAGMNESQIANQDMQTLMTNINTLNQQVADTNYLQLQAKQQYDLAQDTAYQQWLSNANAMGQSGAAYSASGAGDLTQKYKQLKQLMPNKTDDEIMRLINPTTNS